MNASRQDFQSNASTSPEASSPSHPMLTMVGLGPPLLEEPLLAGTTAYLEEDSVAPSQQRTIVGFPTAPEPNLYDATELDDMPNDAITTVMNYDEITVVTRRPALAEARTFPSEPLAADGPLAADESLADEADDAPPKVPSFLDLAPPVEPLAKSEGTAVAEAAELVEPEPEIKIFPPSLDSLVPPRWTLDIPLLSPSAKLASTSEAPWFVSVETPKPARLPRAHHVALIALVVGAVALGAVALRPSTGQVLVTVGGPRDVAVAGAVVYVDGERGCAPAPCRVTVPIGSRLIGVGAPSYRRPAEKALAVGRGSEEALHFTLLPEAAVETPAFPRAPVAEAPKAPPLPSAEVVSVSDLRVRPEAVKPSLGAQPATVSAPALPHDIDLDRPSENSALVSSKLTLTSSPPCNVVLDGRPLGMTPHEVTVSAGAHSVLFIHPTKGRKSVRVEAVVGKPAVAAVTF